MADHNTENGHEDAYLSASSGEGEEPQQQEDIPVRCGCSTRPAADLGSGELWLLQSQTAAYWKSFALYAISCILCASFSTDSAVPLAAEHCIGALPVLHALFCLCCTTGAKVVWSMAATITSAAASWSPHAVGRCSGVGTATTKSRTTVNRCSSGFSQTMRLVQAQVHGGMQQSVAGSASI